MKYEGRADGSGSFSSGVCCWTGICDLGLLDRRVADDRKFRLQDHVDFFGRTTEGTLKKLSPSEFF
jgi:hypothetical protein